MMFLPILRLGVRNLLLHKLRSLLTMLGTILGVASVIAMLSVGEGSKRHAVEQIRKLGASNVIVRSLKPAEAEDSSAANGMQQNTSSTVLEYGLKYADWSLLQNALPMVQRMVPLVLLQKNVEVDGRRIPNARVIGTTPEFSALKNMRLWRGRFLRASDQSRSNNVVVLGPGAARRLFAYRDPLGHTVLIGDGAYRVIGVVAAEVTAGSTPGAVGVADLNDDVLHSAVGRPQPFRRTANHRTRRRSRLRTDPTERNHSGRRR